MKPAHTLGSNGRVAVLGSACTAASYCACRTASGALLSHGKRESAQNTA